MAPAPATACPTGPCRSRIAGGSLTSGGGPGGGVAGKESTKPAIRFRVASFGSGPIPAWMFSSMCAGFVVPVRTINARPNARYFGAERGITYYNFTSDQFSGFHGITVPGTLRDSLLILAGLLE